MFFSLYIVVLYLVSNHLPNKIETSFDFLAPVTVKISSQVDTVDCPNI